MRLNLALSPVYHLYGIKNVAQLVFSALLYLLKKAKSFSDCYYIALRF